MKVKGEGVLRRGMTSSWLLVYFIDQAFALGPKMETEG